MSEFKIHSLPLMRLTDSHRRLMYLASIVEPASMYASIFYIEGARQKILVDAGGSAEELSRRGLPVEHIAYPEEVLKRVGVSPDDIDLIICTHLHIDHNALGTSYKRARFIVQKKELEAALNPHPIEAPIFSPRDSFADLDFEVIEGDIRMLDGLDILFTPGHTAGGQSVKINTEQGKVIICGLCTTRNNFFPQEIDPRSMSVIPPSIHVNVQEAYDSLVRIKREADVIIPLHSI